jgi:hypothetical protein
MYESVLKLYDDLTDYNLDVGSKETRDTEYLWL